MAISFLLLQHADKQAGGGGGTDDTGNVGPHSLHQEEVFRISFLPHLLNTRADMGTRAPAAPSSVDFPL